MRLQTRGLADGTLRFEKDDVVNLKILPVYTTMLINRGRYLAAFNQHERAIAAMTDRELVDRLARVDRRIEVPQDLACVVVQLPPVDERAETARERSDIVDGSGGR